MKNWLILIIVGTFLGGCATSADRAAADDEKCRSYGAKPGSPDYVQCRTQLDAARTNSSAIIATGRR